MAHTPLLALTLVVASTVLAQIALAESKPDIIHLRTIDSRMRALVREGIRSSASFRALVDRINRSDVVVYIQCDGYTSPSRMTFMTSAGGLRYVLVRVQRMLLRDQQLAIMAHELQHAVEVADAPAIVDEVSLAQEYRKIGYVNRYSMAPGIAFDSVAAVETGQRVLRELASGQSD